MKFGKQLLRASEAHTQLCAVDQWLDYKKLKKILGSFPTNEKNGGTDAEKPNETIQSSPHERNFFKLMRSELKKVTQKFCLIRARLLEQISQLTTQQKQMLYLFTALHDSLSKKEELKQLLGVQLELNVETHLDLILLESYAVLNYIGFRKILKKHDKVTGYKTQEKYMLKLVDGKPFASHPWIGKCLKLVEAQFEELRRCKESHDALSSSPMPINQVPIGVPSTSLGTRKITTNFSSSSSNGATDEEEKSLVDLNPKERERYLQKFKQHAQQYKDKHKYMASHSVKRKNEEKTSGPEKKQCTGAETQANSKAVMALESLAVAAEIASNINQTENEQNESQSE